MIRNIIFDWSGTLNDNVKAFYEAASIVFNKLGRKMISFEETKREFTLPYMVFWNKYFPDLTLEEEQKLYYEAIHQVPDAEIYDGVKEFLIKMKALGINLLVLSSDPNSKLLPEVEKAGLKDVFLEVIGEIHEKDGVITHLIEKYNFDPNETIYVGDTYGDITAGKGAGVVSVGITWGFQLEEKIREANPDFIISNIFEIEKLL
ncbi:MAG: HAD family hydrolase [archaeon]|nr:HAD family hydrolase [Nanoarchaeota archaeon]